MGVSTSLILMWIFYAFMGIFPTIYVMTHGGKKK